MESDAFCRNLIHKIKIGCEEANGVTLEPNEEEPTELISFCDKKIIQLRNRQKKANKNDKIEDMESFSGNAQYPVGWKYQVEKLKVENMNLHLKKVSRAVIEDATDKKMQREKASEIKAKEFLKRKLKILEESKIEQKYMEHFTERTAAVLLADIIKNSISPLATSEDIWKEFLKPLNNTPS